MKFRCGSRGLCLLLTIGMGIQPWSHAAGSVQEKRIDSLTALVKSSASDTDRVKAISRLARNYLYISPDSSIRLYTLQLNLSRELNYPDGIADACIGLSNYYYVKGEYVLALSNYFEALSIHEEMGNKRGISSASMGIGLINRELGEYEDALTYLERAKNGFEQLGNNNQVASTLVNIAGTYHYMAEYERALSAYEEALVIAEEVQDARGMSNSLIGIGVVNSQLENYDEALVNYLKALELVELSGEKRSMVVILANLGSLYARQKKWDASLAMTHRSVKIAEELGVLSGIKDGYFNLSEASAAKGEYENAYDYYKHFSEIKDSLFNESKSKEIGKLEAKFEFERAETERARVEEERQNRLAETQRRRDNLQYSGILIFLVALVALSLMLGKLSIPIRLAEGLIFFTFLLFFEFTLVLLDPYIETYSSGEPAWKLLFNAVLAAMIFPLHSFFETMLKGRMVK